MLNFTNKFILSIVAVILFAIPAFASCDYSKACPAKAYGLSSKFGQNLSKKIGATSLSEKIAQDRLKEELRLLTSQKFDVTVKSYSFLDLINGRIKSITISGKNLNINGAYLTALDVQTLCDFNYVQLNRKPIKFKENMVLSFVAKISDKDLLKTMSSNGYLDRMNCVNVEGCGITFFKLSGAKVKIKNNKLYFTVKVTSQLLLAKPLDIVLATDLKVEDGRIVFTEVDLGQMSKISDLKNFAYRLNAMNPLAFSLDVLENENTKMCIKSVNIVGDEIIVSGNVFIPKNTGRSKNEKKKK